MWRGKVWLYLENVLLGFWHLLGATLWMYTASPGRGYAFNWLISLDEFGNALTLGDRNETISSRAAKARNEGREWGCILCRVLDKIQANHCDMALEPEEGKNAVIPD
jgi:hypothetical protein